MLDGNMLDGNMRDGAAQSGPGSGVVAGRRGRASRWLPGWMRFILALWAVTLLLLAFHQGSLFLFMLSEP